MLDELDNPRLLEERRFQTEDQPSMIIMDYDTVTVEPPAHLNGYHYQPETRPILAIFCYEAPQSPVGLGVANLAAACAHRQMAVHIFARQDFELEANGVTTHGLGDCEGEDIVGSATEFANQASELFAKMFADAVGPITLFGQEWSSILAVSLVSESKSFPFLLSLHSLERQRSDMSSDLSQRIEAIEWVGLHEARHLFVQDAKTAELVRNLTPDCAERITELSTLFSVEDFSSPLDPGTVKARFQIAPLEPMIVYVGDLDKRYGPDLLLKAMPAVLKNHPQARLVIVGEGDLYWPLRVYTRYLLLEHAVRLVGSIVGTPLRELVQAADMVVVPSREDTPWWPIQAAWAACRPVVATHAAAPGLLEHEHDSVLVYPSENSCVWGIERVLYDEGLRQSLGEQGYAKLDDRFGPARLAALVEEQMTAVKSV